MKNILITFSILFIAFFSCNKTETPAATPSAPTTTTPAVLKGGKGGTHNMVPFTKKDATAVTSRVYIKYAADKAPTDTTGYDEKQNTMTEPGYGPHVHFVQLTTGTYFIRAINGTLSADTVIEIKDTTTDNDLTFTMYLK